jgi:hypothetical protein
MDIYTLKPANKTAAMVVDQAGCTSHIGFTLEQKRANIRAQLIMLKRKMSEMSKKDRSRKENGMKIERLQDQLCELSKKYKIKKRGELSGYIVEIVKERMTKFAWENLLKEAEKRRDATEVVTTLDDDGFPEEII